MAVTVEPGIYIPGIGGVRIEDDIIVTSEGNEVITKSPKRTYYFVIHRRIFLHDFSKLIFVQVSNNCSG